MAGCINAYSALLAERIGFRALYLSGGGVWAASLGFPDLGISTLDDVLTDVRRITDATNLPLLVDADTGFGASAFNIARTVKSLIKSGAGAMHIEDQVRNAAGHRPGKILVEPNQKWSTVSGPRSMPEPIPTSCSWRERMRWRWKDCNPPSTARAHM